MPKSELHRRKMAAKQEAREAAQPQEQPAYDDSSSGDDEPAAPGQRRTGKKKNKIKWKYVAFLFLLFGASALPVLLWVVDNMGSLVGAGVAASFSAAGAKMGLTATPKDRLKLFYEKHNPEKASEVDHLIDKYAGSYPKMIKVLEAKYNDYGFFLGWEKDRTLGAFVKTQAGQLFTSGQYYYKKHMPYQVRKAFYKMYEVLDRIFRPYIDFIRARILDFFPDAKDYIGIPPYYRKPRSSSRRSSSSSSSTKRKRPKAP
mmetsp:Transcript_26919/g.80703  ORF Transcript_26919/g.80703 Transcript_26919/m.80703 type:complete len:258 (+) Transcript_26919:207-980(+)